MTKPARQSSRSNEKAPVDRVERWPIEKLAAYARNPRLHSAEQIDQIAASMQEFGQAQLVVVDAKGEIIAGHGRVLAAEQLGWKQVVVGIARGWSETKKRAYRIADNQIGLVSRWDDELLRVELAGLGSFDLALLGFDEAQLQGFSLDVARGETDAASEWSGMPEFSQEDKLAWRTIKVHFKNQQAIDNFAKTIKQKIGPAARFVWFPEEQKAVVADKEYIASS